MYQRLSSLHAEVVSARTGHTLQRCEQAISMAALACFVAYLSAGPAQLSAFENALSDIEQIRCTHDQDAEVKICNCKPKKIAC
jgi:precorrin-3B methylase